jgi:hypothetical protein
MPPEGPSLLVTWFDNSRPAVEQQSRYFPLPKCSALMAEDHMLYWFRRAKCTIRGMQWQWGDIPRAIPKSRLLPEEARAVK